MTPLTQESSAAEEKKYDLSNTKDSKIMEQWSHLKTLE
jgi:hypothetical protein